MFHVQIYNYGNNWRPHNHSFNLLIEFILKGEESIMQTEPQKSVMFYTDNTVLSCNFLSFSKISLIMFSTGSIGTKLKSVETL